MLTEGQLYPDLGYLRLGQIAMEKKDYATARLFFKEATDAAAWQLLEKGPSPNLGYLYEKFGDLEDWRENFQLRKKARPWSSVGTARIEQNAGTQKPLNSL
jgi:uncharacterized protein HemY